MKLRVNDCNARCTVSNVRNEGQFWVVICAEASDEQHVTTAAYFLSQYLEDRDGYYAYFSRCQLILRITSFSMQFLCNGASVSAISRRFATVRESDRGFPPIGIDRVSRLNLHIGIAFTSLTRRSCYISHKFRTALISIKFHDNCIKLFRKLNEAYTS